MIASRARADIERIVELERTNEALLQELVECSHELNCSCGHPACARCQRHKQLTEFIEKIKETK